MRLRSLANLVARSRWFASFSDGPCSSAWLSGAMKPEMQPSAPDARLASPLVDELRSAIERAHPSQLGPIISEVYRLYAAGHFGDADVESLDTLARSRQRLPPALKPRRSVGSTPRTPESIERRRGWADGTEMPTHHRRKFTRAQLGVVNFLLKWCFEKGACRLPIEAIAGRVGTCKTVVREAVRKAVGLGLIESKEHRRSYWRSDPNTIRLVGQEVKDWLRIGAEMAKRAAGIATRVKAQAGKAWHQRKSDDRRAAATLRRERLNLLRGEAAVESLHGAADRRAREGKGGGSRFADATRKSSFQEEPSVASRRSEVENCPSGSSLSSAIRFAVRRPAVDSPESRQEAPIIDGTAVRWT